MIARNRLGLIILSLLALGPSAGWGQDTGALSGVVLDAVTGNPLASAQVMVDGMRRGDITDSQGRFRVRGLRSGYHLVQIRLIGYHPASRDSILIRGGETVTLTVNLQASAVELDTLVVVGVTDPVLDPLATSSEQRVTPADLRELPVSNLAEALELQAGVVGESYRGGRVGQESYVIDGLQLKNQLDASSEPLGVRIPPDLLEEASLTTNGFSARYGQATSGMINVVTKDGGPSWQGRVAYETDRMFGQADNRGLDRMLVQADGPLVGGIRFAGALDLNGRLDADPVNAPAPTDPLDPRNQNPHILPHNSAEQWDLAGKLTIPLAGRHTARVFALHSDEQRLLFDPAYKYEAGLSPARVVTSNLVTASVQLVNDPAAATPLVLDLKAGYYDREFLRGSLTEPVDYRVGAFSGRRFEFFGEDIARSQDTAAAAAPLVGLDAPRLTDRSPWGVPAFFLGGGPKGDLGWNTFSELRGQADLTVGLGSTSDLHLGGEVVGQQIKTFQRVLGYLPVGDSVPAATASDFSPAMASAYAEARTRLEELAFNVGLRWDNFNPGGSVPGREDISAQNRLSPRLGVSTALEGFTIVASYGLFYQPPDFQFLVDAAFDDTSRTGRFRRGNPSLGFEKATQFEMSVRVRPAENWSVRVNGYVKQFDGLVASVPIGFDPDSSIFGNADLGNVKGVELLLEREFRDHWGMRVNYTLQNATASSSSAFLRLNNPRIDTLTGDTIIPARVEFPLDFDRRHALTLILQGRTPNSTGVRIGGVDLGANWEASTVLRYQSGLPYSKTNAAGDSLVGVPNDFRLPSTSTVDLLLRRTFSLGHNAIGAYLDVRNLFNRQNVVAVRRDTGEPFLDQDSIEERAMDAYLADPSPIPYESPRYRTWADLDGDGVIQGQAELLPMYQRASRDFAQPLFPYGPPRTIRLGFELLF